MFSEQERQALAAHESRDTACELFLDIAATIANLEYVARSRRKARSRKSRLEPVPDYIPWSLVETEARVAYRDYHGRALDFCGIVPRLVDILLPISDPVHGLHTIRRLFADIPPAP